MTTLVQWVLECREDISQSGVQGSLGSLRSFQGFCEVITMFLILLRIYLPLWYVMSHKNDIRILLSFLKLRLKDIFRMENEATFLTVLILENNYFYKILFMFTCNEIIILK